MEPQKIHWQKALDLLNDAILVKQEEIEFIEPIHIRDVIQFNKFGINIPENFIDYDDETIDCSDIAEITPEDIESGKLVKVLNAQIRIDADTANWLKTSNINYNDLLSELITGFYHSLKKLPKNAAL